MSPNEPNTNLDDELNAPFNPFLNSDLTTEDLKDDGDASDMEDNLPPDVLE